MRLSKRLLLVVGLGILLLITACAANDGVQPDEGAEGGESETSSEDGEGEGLRTVRLVSPVGDHILYAPLYVADAMGYFEEEGLEMEVIPSDGSSQAVQLVLADQGDMSPAGVEAVIVGSGAGEDIKSYYEWYSAPIYGIIVPENSDINEIDQLEGATLGITGYEAGEVPVATALLQDEGLEFGTDVEVVPVGEELPSIIQSLDSGTIDAFAGSVTDFTGLRAGGYSFTQLSSPAIEEFPGGIVFAASESALQEDEEMMVGAARAIAKGTHAFLEVDGVGEAATREALPEAWEEEQVGEFWLEAVSDLLTPTDQGAESGIQDTDGWQLYADYLGTTVEGQEPILQESVDAEDIVVNDLLEEINDYDRSQVEEEGQQFVDGQ